MLLPEPVEPILTKCLHASKGRFSPAQKYPAFSGRFDFALSKIFSYGLQIA